MSAHYVDTKPVLTWLDEQVLPQFDSMWELAIILAERSGLQAKSWQRQLIRLHKRSRIDFFALDRLCVLLGEHVSRFCDLTVFEEASL